MLSIFSISYISDNQFCDFKVSVVSKIRAARLRGAKSKKWRVLKMFLNKGSTIKTNRQSHREVSLQKNAISLHKCPFRNRFAP